MTKPLTEAQIAWNRGAFSKAPRTSPKPKGKLAPRSCHPMVIGAAENSTGPTCISCGGPRERRAGLKCEACLS